ncbi:MAG: peptide-modifying radical SAM enzyme CbpB [Candidatus Omnitrophica bacterium]|nr:peptide-modifying radical SAM enzyme CbpB [Candidatus Omnitrophota bacterium]
MSRPEVANNRRLSGGTYFNTGDGGELQPLDIGHRYYIGLVSADTAFWALVKKNRLSQALTSPSFLREYRERKESFIKEMQALRFGLKPSAVYFNPTDRCNLNCSYCYIPEKLRRNGRHMPAGRLLRALETLRSYFKSTLPKGEKPQVVFHGAEPMLNKKAVFHAVERFKGYFRFGVQTNGTLLDDEAIEFLTSRQVSIGLSLDGYTTEVADRLRRTWSGEGVSQKVLRVISRLKGYKNYSVICTVTKENMSYLARLVEFLHKMKVPVCMLNPLRCTLPNARRSKPLDSTLAGYYLKALDRIYGLYKGSGRKLVVANFANVLMGIIAPAGRRLMCDISPCGGGRCFFAVSASGDMFPCSEFIGLKKFRGGNIFRNKIRKVIESKPFRFVTERRIEDIRPCSNCAIRHFCGSPCPAEAHEINGSIESRGAFCEFYVEQVRYALGLVADGKEDAYLWDGWDKEMRTSMEITEL